MANILVLEDMHENYLLIRQALEGQHTMRWASSMATAMKEYDDSVDLVLVDIGLPDGDGFEFCYWIRSRRQHNQVPIIFITARDTVESRITGYSVGGDDYISKPFNLVELKARIDAKLRRTQAQKTVVIDFHGIRADLRSQKAQILEDGKTIDLDLTPLEFKVLNLFLDEPNKVFTRDEILNRVWGKDIYVYPRSVDTHVSKLRRKLLSRADLIKSVHGVGYRLTPPGEELSPLSQAQ